MCLSHPQGVNEQRRILLMLCPGWHLPGTEQVLSMQRYVPKWRGIHSTGICSGFNLYADMGPECVCQVSGRDELEGEVKLVTDADIEGRHWLHASVRVCHSTSSAGVYFHSLWIWVWPCDGPQSAKCGIGAMEPVQGLVLKTFWSICFYSAKSDTI